MTSLTAKEILAKLIAAVKAHEDPTDGFALRQSDSSLNDLLAEPLQSDSSLNDLLAEPLRLEEGEIGAHFIGELPNTTNIEVIVILYPGYVGGRSAAPM